MFPSGSFVVGAFLCLLGFTSGLEVLEIDDVLNSKGLFEGKAVSVNKIDVNAVGKSLDKFNAILSDPGTLDNAYSNYASQFNKEPEEDRKDTFKGTLLSVFEHNMKAKSGQETYTMGVNQFSDLTLDEVKAQYTGVLLPNSTDGFENQSPNLPSRFRRDEAPEAKDWREDNDVTPPKNQGQCGSCTLFAVTGAVESAMAISKGQKGLDLSEQELLDCPTGSGVGKCQGNWPEDIYEYQKKQGQTTEAAYKYEGKSGKCRAKGKQRSAKVKSYYKSTEGDENAMKELLGQYGPVSVVITINDEFKNYKEGVMNTPCSGNNFDHSVLAVGYGNENGEDYWIVKNSWGTRWGDGGFIKMARNADNICRIADYAILPTVV